MEQDWVRQETSLSISLESAQAMLAPHALRPISIEPFSEGKANSNAKLRLDDGRLAVLRSYQRDKSVQPLELALHSRFQGRLPIPNVLASDIGAGWVLLEFLPGRTIQRAAEEGRADEALAAAPGIGIALATIASVQFDQAGLIDADLQVREPWPSVTEGLDGYLQVCLARPFLLERIGADTVGTISRLWESSLSDIAAFTKRPMLSHGDFKPSNLLIDDGRLSGVLDWEFAHAGTWLLDAGQILRHRHELPTGFGEGIGAGLVEGGLDVPEGWQRYTGIIDLMNLVDFIGRPICKDSTVRHISRLIAETFGTTQ